MCGTGIKHLGLFLARVALPLRSWRGVHSLQLTPHPRLRPEASDCGRQLLGVLAGGWAGAGGGS